MAYDVTIVGLGGMGSAILSHSARRGASVVGLEQFTPAHDLGSSHGKSRMIRKAYFEDPAYVPLLLRAYDLWRELEDRTGQELLQITGLLMVGHEAAEIITGAQRAAREHNLPLESLSTRELRARYPMLRVQNDEIGAFEPEGGVLDPERCVQAHLDEAGKAGAQMRFGIAMQNWEATDDGFVVRLADGDRIESRALVLSLGPWFQETLGKLGVTIRVQRNVQTWFEPATDVYYAGRFPAFLLDRIGLPAPLYGFPDFGDGVKAAFHAHGDLSKADEIVREVDPRRDVEPVRKTMDAWMPGATATFRSAKVCPYSLTPDSHFVVDRHPQHPGLVLCGGFSGHGFKFAPVIGEIAADLALAGTTRQEIAFLSLQRFENASFLE